MFMSRRQKAKQNKIFVSRYGNKTFGKVEMFRQQGTTETYFS
jgi:hypothetical protein